MTPFVLTLLVAILILFGIAIGMLLSMPERLRLSNENAMLHMRLEASNPIHSTTQVVKEPQFLLVTTKQHDALVRSQLNKQLLAPLVKMND